MKKIMTLVLCLTSASSFFSSSVFAQTGRVSNSCAEELVILTRALFTPAVYDYKSFEKSISQINEGKVEKAQTLYGKPMGGTFYTLLLENSSENAAMNIRFVLVGEDTRSILGRKQCRYSEKGFVVFAEDKEGQPIRVLN